jgi:hypothetical protein
VTTAVWRPSTGEVWPVLGVVGYGQGAADVVVSMPAIDALIRQVPLDQIEVRQAPRFTDHSTPEGCGCGERAGSSRSSAQAGAGGAVPVTNFLQI